MGAAQHAASANTVVEARTTMADLATYLADVKKYSAHANEAAVAGIVKHLGIALRNKDSSLVSGTDPAEMKRMRDGFLKKKLALTEPDAKLDAAAAAVIEKMKADRTKSRVTVYYLLAEHFKKLDLFVKK
jgi:hypothetical protein